MEIFNVSSYENVLYESEFVVDELVLKVLEYNSRKVSLPLTLEVIVNYFIHSSIDKKDLDITIMLILVKLSVILDMLNRNFNVANQKKLCN